jgi:hypothetical protein
MADHLSVDNLAFDTKSVASFQSMAQSHLSQHGMTNSSEMPALAHGQTEEEKKFDRRQRFWDYFTMVGIKKPF